MNTRYHIPPLPAFYGNPAEEVAACRERCALFDFSFVQQASVCGPQAADFVEQFANRTVDDMTPGKIRYALRLREDGTVLSDLTVWKMSDEHFKVMSGHPPDIQDLCSECGPRVHVCAQDTAIFAVQGPMALEELRPLCADHERLGALGYFEHGTFIVGETQCLVGRLGYSGEAGFELICARSEADALWTLLNTTCPAAGFIAADILRIEAGLPLFWNDFALAVTPGELGLAHFCTTPSSPCARSVKRICFSALSKERPELWRAPTPPRRPTRVGEVAVTSACYSVRMGRVIGLGYVTTETNLTHAPLFDQSGVFNEVRAQSLPIYDTQKVRPRANWPC